MQKSFWFFYSLLSLIIFTTLSSCRRSDGKINTDNTLTIEKAYSDPTVFKYATLEEKWKIHQKNPILSKGLKGEWDEGAIGSMSVIKVRDTLHMYYEAWGLGTIQIGHATSLDGMNWKKDLANPVIPCGKVGEWDSEGTWDVFVIFEDGMFKMWYGGGIGQTSAEWGYAYSKGGSHFIKMGQISHIGNVEDDHVIHDHISPFYYMYYWDRAYEPMGLFRAESVNETAFDFENAIRLSIEGEENPVTMYKFTHVIKGKDKWYMFYSNFVRPHCPNATVRIATSTDGINWTSKNKNLFRGQDGEILELKENVYLMYYGPQGHFDMTWDCDVRLAVYIGELDAL